MKFKIPIICTLLLAVFSSCIKDEASFREADIEAFTLADTSLVNISIISNRVDLIVKPGTNYKAIVPLIKISEGATITPASGDTIDLTNDVIYTVISEDKRYRKEYTVSLKFPQLNLKYDFEDWGLGGALWKFPILNDLLWSSANGGIVIATTGKLKEYPTRSTNDAVTGSTAALLETLKGGTFFGKHIPIFAGSLFRGKFKLDMNSPAKSTLFGQLHTKEMGKPTTLTGYYKYTPGEEFGDENGKIIPGAIDECAIYAVLYKIDKGAISDASYVNGTDIFTSDKVVAKAILFSTGAKEYTKFTLPFIYTENPDYTKYDYRLALTFSSSKDGDTYKGAIGSILKIDNVEILCEKYKD